jgi:hypothetical protein
MSTKDWIEVAMYMVAILGGLTTAVLAIFQQKLANVQRKRELRWNQARMGKELMDQIFDEAETADALDMLDMEPGFVNYPGSTDPVTIEAVRAALDARLDQRGDRALYIQRCFNFLAYHLNQLEHFINTHLVSPEDVSQPSEYYAGVLARHKPLIKAYFTAIGYTGALRFLDRFSTWREVREMAPRPKA